MELTWSTVKQSMKSVSYAEIEEMKVIGRLVSKRKELGYTQRDLAEMTGIDQSSIARLESNIVSPRLITVLRICKALNLDLTK